MPAETATHTATPEAIEAFGERYAYDVSYMLHLLRLAPDTYGRFDAFLPLAAPGPALTADAAAVAKVVSYVHQRCGPCVQLALRMAREAGVAAELLREVLAEGELPWHLADVRAFCRILLDDEQPAPELAARLEAHYGEAGRAELAVAVASARVFPALKRGLGFAQPYDPQALEV